MSDEDNPASALTSTTTLSKVPTTSSEDSDTVALDLQKLLDRKLVDYSDSGNTEVRRSEVRRQHSGSSEFTELIRQMRDLDGQSNDLNEELTIRTGDTRSDTVLASPLTHYTVQLEEVPRYYSISGIDHNVCETFGYKLCP